jgi:hypothetical protein
LKKPSFYRYQKNDFSRQRQNILPSGILPDGTQHIEMTRFVYYFAVRFSFPWMNG